MTLAQRIAAAHVDVQENPSLDEDAVVHEAVVVWLKEQAAGVGGVANYTMNYLILMAEK